MVEMFLEVEVVMVMVAVVTAAAAKPRQDAVSLGFTAMLLDIPDGHPH